MILASEEILNDDHPVHAGFVYLVDEVPTISDIKGTILDLKFYLKRTKKREIKEIRRCNLAQRNLLG